MVSLPPQTFRNCVVWLVFGSIFYWTSAYKNTVAARIERGEVQLPDEETETAEGTGGDGGANAAAAAAEEVSLGTGVVYGKEFGKEVEMEQKK